MTFEDIQRLIETHTSNRPSSDDLIGMCFEKWHPGGANPKYLATDSNDAKWIVKFCKNDANRVPEICDREVLISLFGKVLTVPVVESWTISVNEINIDINDIARYEREIVRDKAVLMRMLIGDTVGHNRTAAAAVIEHAPERVADLFAFMYWVGDEDRGLEDVFIAGDYLTLIDNGLCGPNVHDFLRGYHPFPEVYQYDNRVKMCYGGKSSFVAFVLRDCRIQQSILNNPAVLERIEQLDFKSIVNITRSLSLSDYVAIKLSNRTLTLRNEYADWLKRAVTLCVR
jgi:hypothetical protein